MSDMSRYTEALRTISPDCSRDDWVKVGMALHHETAGSSEGLECWHAWSKRSGKYNRAETDRQWNSFKAGGGITGGTLIAMAIERGHHDYQLNGHSPAGVLQPRAATKSKPTSVMNSTVVARYDYFDAAGEFFGTKVRLEPKSFRWQRRNPSTNCPPYGLLRLMEHADEPVWAVEGEKDAARLNDNGLVAISVESGHEAHAATFLRDRVVYIVPDNDEQGRKRARALRDATQSVTASALIVTLPGLAEKEDVSDWLDAGHSISDLVALAGEQDTEVQNATLSAAFTLFNDITLELDPEFLVDDVVPKTGIGWLYAPPGLAKSFVVQDLCASVARGIPFAGHYDVEQGGVVLIALEAPEGVKKRLFGYRKANGVNSMPLAVLKYPLDLREKESVGGLVALLDEFRAHTGTHTRLVVIDTLAKAMPGADENSSKDMGLAIAGLQTIQNATGGFVMAVHHSGKDGDRGGRGHSSGEGAMDCELVLRGKKTDAVRELYLRKLKDGEDTKTIATFRLEQVKLGVNRKGKEITSAVVKWLGTARPKKEIELTPAQRAVVEHINQLILNGQHEATKDADGVPAGMKAVGLEDLMLRCLKGGNVTNAEKPHTQRVAIRKQITKLNRRGVVGMFDEKVWLIREK